MTGFHYSEISQKSNGGTEISCRMLEETLPQNLLENFQIIPSRVREIDDSKIRIFYAHDLPQDPEASHLKDSSSRDRFHKAVFVSSWQRDAYHNILNIPRTNWSTVISNPIVPFEKNKKKTETIRIIYTSTPQRGLGILVPVFQKLCEEFDNIELDVFSSFNIYGWDDPPEFNELLEVCKNSVKIKYHGFQPNDVVRQALANAHVFAYPSIWQETSCRALMEAMSAGCICIHPDLAALRETSGGLNLIYDYTDDMNEHASVFYSILYHTILNINNKVYSFDENQNTASKTYVDLRYNIKHVSGMWENLLQQLLNKYPTVESRNIKKHFFNYNTSI